MLISVITKDIISNTLITPFSELIAMAICRLITRVMHVLMAMVTHPPEACNSSNIDVCIWWGIQGGRLWGEVHPGYSS